MKGIDMSKLSHSNDETMKQIELKNRLQREEISVHDKITHDEWYTTQNRISQLEAAMREIIKEATTEIDGHVYVPAGFGRVVSLARDALKVPESLS